MSKKIINTPNAPQAIGPYSQAVVVDKFIYISGQLPLDPETMQFAGEDIKSQTKQSLINIRAILAEANYSLDDVVKVNVFLKDMNTFNDMNEVYAQFFASSKPARAAVEVARLPKDALIEIEAIAYKE